MQYSFNHDKQQSLYQIIYVHPILGENREYINMRFGHIELQKMIYLDMIIF